MKCYVIEAGWIIVGKEVNRTDDMVELTNASVVRSWSNGRGIGGIAKAEYKDEYILDAIGDVEIAKSKILFEIPCEWEE